MQNDSAPQEREKTIPEQEHSLLLYKLNNLPHADERVCRLEQELKERLSKYQALLGDLKDTVRSYIEAEFVRACREGRVN